MRDNCELSNLIYHQVAQQSLNLCCDYKTCTYITFSLNLCWLEKISHNKNTGNTDNSIFSKRQDKNIKIFWKNRICRKKVSTCI